MAGYNVSGIARMYHTWPVDMGQIRLLRTCINVSDLGREAKSQEAEGKTESHEPEARSRYESERNKSRIQQRPASRTERAHTCVQGRMFSHG